MLLWVYLRWPGMVYGEVLVSREEGGVQAYQLCVLRLRGLFVYVYHSV